MIAQETKNVMADHADDNDDDDGNIFVYRGGRAPQHVTHVRIDKSIDVIEDDAFSNCRHLVKVKTHNGIRKVGSRAFWYCKSLPQNLKSAVEIGEMAFYNCEKLVDVEFGDELDTVGKHAFRFCSSLKHLKLPSIITIEGKTFAGCIRLIDVEFSGRLETIGARAFWCSEQLRRIAIPLKRDLFAFDERLHYYSQFDSCNKLVKVDLIGADGVHKTVASLHMESWRADMLEEISRINHVLPTTNANEKTNEIVQWMEWVMDKMDHYKAEHCRHVKEGTTLLELALWKAKLDGKEENCGEGRTKKAKIDAESARKERRVTCGADIVIKNVLPFLQLE